MTQRSQPTWWVYTLFGWFLILLFGVWALPYLREYASPSFRIGQPAPYTVIAGTRLVYMPSLSPSPGRSQPSSLPRQALEWHARLQTVLNYIDVLRAARELSLDEKVEDLLLITELNLSPQEARQLLALPLEVWEQVQVLAPRAFLQLSQDPGWLSQTDQIARQLRDVLPSEIPVQVMVWIQRLVLPYLELYAQTASVDVIGPQVRIYEPGQPVVRQGEPVDQVTYQVLTRLHLALPSGSLVEVVRSLQSVLLFLAAWVFILVMHFLRTPILWNWRTLLALQLGFLGMLLLVRYLWSLFWANPWLFFLFPLPLYALLVYLLLDSWTGLIWGVGLIFLSLLDFTPAGPFLLYHILSGLTALLVLKQPQSLREYIWALLSMMVVALLVLLGYAAQTQLPAGQYASWFLLAPLYSVLTAGLTLFLEYILSWPTGRITRLRLMDLARPDHPLLQLLVQKAPGTYQHSVMVGNLAEEAARRIGADAFLCRVGALYHDIGKTVNPQFFIENQTMDMTNPHAGLDPYQSATILREHVSKGLELAAQYRLPPRIRDFIREHHGTTLLRGPYMRALEAAGGDPDRVAMEAFRYPGPRPRSKETAILMLADICEARVRAQQPTAEEEIRQLVRDSIEMRFREGELDESGLSIRDLREIEDAFVRVLMGAYHQRVVYPGEEKRRTRPAGMDHGTGTRRRPSSFRILEAERRRHRP